MKRYGLIAMSAKPYHKGHHAAVEKAASECDEVRLFISLSDRTRPGEVPIFGADMEIVWKTQLESIMPANVRVEYVKVPVASAYDFAGQVEKSGEEAEIVFYADQEDLDKNFPEVKMAKYFPRLEADGLIHRSATARLFSGTKMRQFLASGDSAGFMSMLPDGIDKEAVWELLSAGASRSVAVKPKAAKKGRKQESWRPSLKRLIFG
jgi:hypothetical protein